MHKSDLHYVPTASQRASHQLNTN